MPVGQRKLSLHSLYIIQVSSVRSTNNYMCKLFAALPSGDFRRTRGQVRRSFPRHTVHQALGEPQSVGMLRGACWRGRHSTTRTVVGAKLEDWVGGVDSGLSTFVPCTHPCLYEGQRTVMYCLLCVFSSHAFWTSSSLDVPAGVTGFFIHLPSAVRALIFLARRIQPFFSLVYHEAEFFVY